LISPFLAAAVLMVQDRVAADPLWLQIGQAFQAWATPLLIAIGGVWAFYRFRLRRESRRRLKVEVAGRVERATGLTGVGELIYLVVTTTVTNIGDAEVRVDDTLLVLESLDFPSETTRPPWVANWNDLLSGVGINLGLAAFEDGRTLEPGEPVEERVFLGLPDSGYGAIRVTATVASRDAQRSWFNDEVVVVDPRVDNGMSGEAASGPAQKEGGAP
jgi:hypothetical protein